MVTPLPWEYCSGISKRFLDYSDYFNHAILFLRNLGSREVKQEYEEKTTVHIEEELAEEQAAEEQEVLEEEKQEEGLTPKKPSLKRSTTREKMELSAKLQEIAYAPKPKVLLDFVNITN